MEISAKQRRQLRELAHKLEPSVIVGQKGLSDAVLQEIEAALRAHELIKVRIPRLAHELRDEWTARMCERLGAQLVARIGHVVSLFRRNREKPRLLLPGSRTDSVSRLEASPRATADKRRGRA